jgi:hypothetical protein
LRWSRLFDEHVLVLCLADHERALLVALAHEKSRRGLRRMAVCSCVGWVIE